MAKSTPFRLRLELLKRQPEFLGFLNLTVPFELLVLRILPLAPLFAQYSGEWEKPILTRRLFLVNPSKKL
jgi:hypothetical protein